MIDFWFKQDMKSGLLGKRILGHLTLSFAPIIISAVVRGRHITIITNLRGNKLLKQMIYFIGSAVFLGRTVKTIIVFHRLPLKKTQRL